MSKSDNQVFFSKAVFMITGIIILLINLELKAQDYSQARWEVNVKSQHDSITINGSIRDSRHRKPIDSVKIIVINNAEEILSSMTNEDGEFIIRLPFDSSYSLYRINLEKTGYSSYFDGKDSTRSLFLNNYFYLKNPVLVNVGIMNNYDSNILVVYSDTTKSRILAICALSIDVLIHELNPKPPKKVRKDNPYVFKEREPDWFIGNTFYNKDFK